MHPEVKREAPGKCPKCGMDLVPLEEQARTKHEHTMHVEEIRRNAIVSTVLTIPVVLYSKSVQELLGFSMPKFTGSEWITPALSTALFTYSGPFFFKGAVGELKLKKPGMMTLVSLAVSVAFLYSMYALFSSAMDFFWELSTLITVMLWGHYIEMRSILGASRALEQLVRLIPTKANLIINSEVVEVPVSQLKFGDMVLVKPGEKVPVDGTVIDGFSSLDESLITGESKPVFKKAGEKVIGGSVNLESVLKVRVEKTGEESYVNQMIKLVKQAQESKTRLQDIADRVAFVLTICAVFVGLISFLLWSLIMGDPLFGVERAVSVMVIACPHALGLAIPLVVAISTSYASTKGILVRNRLSLELLRKVDTVVFDKTGTLTEGRFSLLDVYSKAMDKKEMLELCANLEVGSEHMVAKAIVESVKGVKLEEVKEFVAYPGRGVSGKVKGRSVVVGTEGLMEELRVEMDEDVLRKGEEFEAQGKNAVFVSVNNLCK